MTEIAAVANAVEKAAEFGTQTLQTSEKAGGFIARVFKDPIEAGVGMLTDRLRVMRLKRWDEMADEVDEILKRRRVTGTRPVPPKFGIPLLEQAALEDEDELKVLWSRLLANAMDPGFVAELRTAYIEIAKSLSPLDARLLYLMHQSLHKTKQINFQQAQLYPFNERQICTTLGISSEDYALSVNNLMRLQCLAPHVKRIKLGGGLVMSGGDKLLAADEGTASVIITPLGIGFVNAVIDEPSLDKEDVLHSRYSHTETIDVGIRVANF